MKKAGEIGDIGLNAARKSLKPGVSLWEVIAIAEDAMRKAGGITPFQTW